MLGVKKIKASYRQYDLSKHSVYFDIPHRLSQILSSLFPLFPIYPLPWRSIFMSTTHRDTKAWEAGLKSAEKGQPLNKCPHERNSIQAKSWEAGYAEGLAMKKENKQS